MPGDSWGGGLNGDEVITDSVMSKSKSNLVESGVFSGQESNVSEAEADIYALLEQKERDLLLAAELGKALLEKNEELSQTNEKMAEDFSSKLEVRQKSFHNHSLKIHIIHENGLQDVSTISRHVLKLMSIK